MKPKVLVVQRQTNVAEKPMPSRSIYARILEPFEYLKQKGKIDFIVIDENNVSKLDLKTFNSVVFQKHSSRTSIETAAQAKALKVKVIYDIDDFLPAFPNYSGGQKISEKITAIKQHTQIADIVTAATPFLKDQIDQYFALNSIFTPNGINVERHRAFCKGIKKQSFVFTNADLLKIQAFKDDFFRAINTFLSKNPTLQFDVISDPNPEIDQFERFNNIGNLDWFEHKQVLAQSGYEFAVIPLGGKEDPNSLLFNQCKSPIKYLEYGCLGIPGVYSNVDIYKTTIQHGVTGILVKNTFDDWTASLKELRLNNNLRQFIAKNALDDIIAHYSVTHSSQIWLELLRN